MDRDAIEKELLQFPTEWIVAFAARCAAQCLPGLLERRKPTDNRYFVYWPKEERNQHLFAVLRANSITTSYAFPDAVYGASAIYA